MSEAVQPVASEDIGERPELVWLDPEQLIVDPRYQRDVTSERSQALVRRICREFHWHFFQPLTVADNADGTYVIIDGQHRAEAARRHPAVGEVPCYLIDADTLAEQAAAFAAINNARVRLNGLQIFHADLAARQPAALALKAVLVEADVTVPRNNVTWERMRPGETLAIGSLRSCLKHEGAAVLGRALTILRRGVGDRPGEIRAATIKALVALLAREGDRIDDERMVLAIAAGAVEDREDLARRLAKEERVSPSIVLQRLLRDDYRAAGFGRVAE